MKITDRKIDTAGAHLDVIAKAKENMNVQPPAEFNLSAKEVEHFNQVVKELSRAELSPHTVTVCAMLARTICAHAENLRLMDLEGFEDARAAASRVKINASLALQIMSFRRTLGIHATTGGRKAKNVQQAREVAKSIERDALGNFDDLLPTAN